eukprot:scaffold234909_cov24-Tisochrysis_lutea.AAC.1
MPSKFVPMLFLNCMSALTKAVRGGKERKGYIAVPAYRGSLAEGKNACEEKQAHSYTCLQGSLAEEKKPVGRGKGLQCCTCLRGLLRSRKQ